LIGWYVAQALGCVEIVGVERVQDEPLDILGQVVEFLQCAALA
jgi:hypothetical protein